MGKNFLQNRYFKIVFVALVIISNVGCDQISKKIVREEVRYFERIPVIDPYLMLTKVENTGAFLGWGENYHPLFKKVIFTILPALVLLVASVFLFSHFKMNFFAILGIGFMVGGGIGNIFDRVIYNSVTDFLHIDFGFVSTGIFNMADVSIMVGLFFMMIPYFKTRKEEFSASAEKLETNNE